jgi:hypothetical protein
MARIAIEGVNLNETPKWDGEGGGLPPGEYCFRIDGKPEVTNAKSSGKPQLQLKLVVEGSADGETYNGQTMTMWYSLAPKAAKRLKCILDAAGVPCAAEGDFESDDFEGKFFIAEVFSEEYATGETNMQTGDPVMRTATRLKKERTVDEGYSNQTAAAPAEEAPAAPAPAAAAPAPVAKAVPGPRVSVVPPPAAKVAAPAPKVGGAFPKPGVRAPAPARQ